MPHPPVASHVEVGGAELAVVRLQPGGVADVADALVGLVARGAPTLAVVRGPDGDRILLPRGDVGVLRPNGQALDVDPEPFVALSVPDAASLRALCAALAAADVEGLVAALSLAARPLVAVRCRELSRGAGALVAAGLRLAHAGPRVGRRWQLDQGVLLGGAWGGIGVVFGRNPTGGGAGLWAKAGPGKLPKALRFESNHGLFVEVRIPASSEAALPAEVVSSLASLQNGRSAEGWAMLDTTSEDGVGTLTALELSPASGSSAAGPRRRGLWLFAGRLFVRVVTSAVSEGLQDDLPGASASAQDIANAGSVLLGRVEKPGKLAALLHSRGSAASSLGSSKLRHGEGLLVHYPPAGAAEHWQVVELRGVDPFTAPCPPPAKPPAFVPEEAEEEDEEEDEDEEDEDEEEKEGEDEEKESASSTESEAPKARADRSRSRTRSRSRAKKKDKETEKEKEKDRKAKDKDREKKEKDKDRDRSKERDKDRRERDRDKEKVREKEKEREKEREKQREREKEREKEKEKEREREKRREKEKEKEKDRDRDRERDREKEKEKEKDRDRDRDREREREKERQRRRSSTPRRRRTGFDQRGPQSSGSTALAMVGGQPVSSAPPAPGPPIVDPEVEAFLAANPVDQGTAARFRALPLNIQRLVLIRGSLVGTRDPSAVLMSRVRDAIQSGGTAGIAGVPQLPPGGMQNPEVEAFLADNPVDFQAASRLRALPSHLQRLVLIRGSLSGVRDASSVLMSRIRDAMSGRAPGQSGMGMTGVVGMPGMQMTSNSFRPGDWLCTRCGFHNYSSKMTCTQCGAPMPPGAMAGMVALPGGQTSGTAI